MANEARPNEQEDSTPVGPTPGPWGMRDTHDFCTEINSPLFEDPYNCLANVNARWMWNGDGTDPVQAANARLIAAAPLMRDALNQARVELRILQSAIQCGEDWTPTLDNSYRIMRAQIDAALAAAQPPAESQVPDRE